MLMIPLNSIPADERHLLYCSDPAVLGLPAPEPEIEAVNRALSIHGEGIDELAALPRIPMTGAFGRSRASA